MADILTKMFNTQILPNKIVVEPKCGLFKTHIQYGMLLIRQYKVPVVLKYEKQNMIITPGEGQIINRPWLIYRLADLASQCEYGF